MLIKTCYIIGLEIKKIAIDHNLLIYQAKINL